MTSFFVAILFHLEQMLLLALLSKKIGCQFLNKTIHKMYFQKKVRSKMYRYHQCRRYVGSNDLYSRGKKYIAYKLETSKCFFKKRKSDSAL